MVQYLSVIHFTFIYYYIKENENFFTKVVMQNLGLSPPGHS